MLILSTHVGEEISLNDGQIIVCVISLKNNTVRLGLTAPDEVKIKLLKPKKKADLPKTEPM